MLENRSSLTLKGLVYYVNNNNNNQCGGRLPYLDRTMGWFQFYHKSHNTAPYVNTLRDETCFMSDFTEHVFTCESTVQDTRVSKPIES